MCFKVDISKRLLPNLSYHKRAKHEGVIFQCEECDYRVTSKYSLAQHRRALHEKIKYPCDTCNYESTRKSNLAKHQRLMHDVKDITFVSNL